MGLFIKKPFSMLQAEANESGAKTLKRVLGAWSLVALGVGVIIGAGLFSITGTVAAGYTGPAITLSFAIAAIGCCFAGLCYAEFASMIPVAGSAYTYSYATMRADSVDNRLGLGSGIYSGSHHSQHQLEQIPRRLSRRSRNQPSACTYSLPVGRRSG